MFQSPESSRPPGGDAAPRCLIVGGDAETRGAIRHVIQTQGLSVVEASSGMEAEAALAAMGPVPLLVVDYDLPDVEGTAFLHRMLDRSPDTLVLMIGEAGLGVRTVVGCLREGAADFLVKPVSREEVRARVDRALDQRRRRLENQHLQRSYRDRLEENVRALAARNREMFLGQVQMAVRMLEKKDEFTRGHSERVSRYAEKTAVLLGFTGDTLDQIRLGGDLHDIGKIGTRDAILLKPGPLTSEEFQEVQRHVVEGEEILEPLRRDSPLVLQIVRHHHERFDGTGFPDGLAGPAIPAAARIVAVVDAFDAMTTNRAYRPVRAPLDAMEELTRCAGAQFDPEVVAAFRRAFPDPARLLGSV